MTNSPLVTYNPLSQDNSGKRTHCMDQLSVKKFADKTRKQAVVLLLALRTTP